MHMVDLTFFMSSYFFNFIFQTKSYFVFIVMTIVIFFICYVFMGLKFHFFNPSNSTAFLCKSWCLLS